MIGAQTIVKLTRNSPTSVRDVTRELSVYCNMRWEFRVRSQIGEDETWRRTEYP